MLLRFNYFGAGTLVKCFKFAFHCAFAASDRFLRRFCQKIYVSDLNFLSSCVKISWKCPKNCLHARLELNVTANSFELLLSRTIDIYWKNWLESRVIGYGLVIQNYVLQKIETSSQSRVETFEVSLLWRWYFGLRYWNNWPNFCELFYLEILHSPCF